MAAPAAPPGPFTFSNCDFSIRIDHHVTGGHTITITIPSQILREDGSPETNTISIDGHGWTPQIEFDTHTIQALRPETSAEPTDEP